MISLRRAMLALTLFVFSFAGRAEVGGPAVAYQKLTVGTAKVATNWTLDRGNSRFHFASAKVAPVFAGDEQVGIFVSKGSAGDFRYRSKDKTEHLVQRYNVKHASDVTLSTVGDAQEISETIQSVLFLGRNLPAVDGTEETTVAEEFAANRAIFGRAKLQPVSHSLALLKLDAPPSTNYLRAEMQTVDDPLLYEFDDFVGHAEFLFSLRKRDFIGEKLKNSLFAATLSVQPIGRTSHQAVPARYRITKVDVALTASAKDDASMTVTETLTPVGRPQRLFSFELYDEYWTDTDRPPRKYNVRSVKDSTGRELAFSHAADELLVDLIQPISPGTAATLTFEIDGNILYRPGGDSYWELGAEPWFPQSGQASDTFTFHGLVKVKKPFVPFSPGRTIRRTTEGDYNVVESEIDKPVGYIAILAGKYNFREETRNGITIRVASYAMKNDAAYKKLAGLAFGVIDHYKPYLGAFPFSELNIIEKNDYGYGQAPPATMFITKEAFTPMLGDANDYVKGINARFAHEIAHQFWGHVVKWPSREEQWISEAFAEYSSALFVKAAIGDGAYRKMVVNWETEAKDASKWATIPTANRLTNLGDPYALGIARNGLIYSKGALLLSKLHKELGDTLFLTFLKSMQASFRWKYASTDDVAGLLKFVTKKDYGDFFEQYYWGNAVPK